MENLDALKLVVNRMNDRYNIEYGKIFHFLLSHNIQF